jgi:Rieske 2Fe-2S family protein
MRQIEKTTEQLIAAHQPGYALDRRFYVDPEIYALEIDRIIMRNWIVAGHQSELREPGDFKILRVANESAIIVRGSDNELRAFANVCRHRGSVVCLKNKGPQYAGRIRQVEVRPGTGVGADLARADSRMFLQ